MLLDATTKVVASNMLRLVSPGTERFQFGDGFLSKTYPQNNLLSRKRKCKFDLFLNLACIVKKHQRLCNAHIVYAVKFVQL